MKKQLLALSLFLSATASFGSGYQLNLQGLRELAMGGTGTAMQWDVSTIFYNPAGLSRINDIQVYGSILAVAPNTAFSNATSIGTSTSSSYNTVSQTFTPFNFYIGGQVASHSKLALGLGIYTPFGTGVQWDANWIGKYMVQEVKLSTVSIQPTISYRVSEFFSVGGGFIFATGTMDYRQALPFNFENGSNVSASNTQTAEAHLHGQGTGVGFNLGTQFKFSDRLYIGLTYRSQVNMDLNGGSATFQVPPTVASYFPTTGFDSQLPLPQVASLGIAVKPDAEKRLTLQLDFNYTGWSSFDSLRFNFFTNTQYLQNEHYPRMYRNTLTSRLGGNYKISRVVSVMAGAAYDPTPVTNGYVSPDLPDADRILLTCGVSVKPARKITLIAALESTNGLKRNGMYTYGNFSGTYQTNALTTGIGAYYNF